MIMIMITMMITSTPHYDVYQALRHADRIIAWLWPSSLAVLVRGIGENVASASMLAAVDISFAMMFTAHEQRFR